MATNCIFILENEEFNNIDEELIPERLQCNFPHYQHGEGCPSCPVYRQIMESRSTHHERMEDVQDIIQKWWV